MQANERSRPDSPKQLLVDLGSRIRTSRLTRNLSQVELATIANVSRTTVIGIEQGKGQIEIQNYLQVLDAMDLAGSFTNVLEVDLPGQEMLRAHLPQRPTRKRRR